ncbi:CHRD domain-containing protein [Noviherbaspirillum sp. ST9]|uniref:CHRD domain-containing protein n=1 Tax=Noviherbaspirillum sp. ST9 TaxID=3401606 RepID=UPI003B5877CA
MGSTHSRSSFIRLVSAAVLASLAACGGDSDPAPVDAAPAATTPTASGATPSGTNIAPLTINLELSGAKEVPPTNSTALGRAVVTIHPTTQQFTATATTTGIVGTAAHIHEGAATDTGPVVFPMRETLPGSGVWTVSGQLTEAQMTALLNERYYINVHSAAFPNGEIRGQIPEE